MCEGFVDSVNRKCVYPGIHKAPSKVQWSYVPRTRRPRCRPVSADPTIGELCVQKGAHVQSPVRRCTIQLENYIRLSNFQLRTNNIFKHVQEVVLTDRLVSSSKKNGPISWSLNRPAHTFIFGESRASSCVTGILCVYNFIFC